MFHNIKQIIVNNDSIEIGDNGIIVGTSVASEKNDVLTLGSSNGSGGGGGGSIVATNGGSIFSGESIFAGGSVSITNSSNGSIMRGPRSTSITINGYKTTYGQIMDWCSGQNGDRSVEPSPPPPVYRLHESCNVRQISCNGSGSAIIAAKWLSKSLAIYIRGSGDVVLPNTDFNSVHISIAGSGGVRGGTTAHASINVAGSGEVSGLYVTGSGCVSVAGSGEVRLTADDPDSISRSMAGSGEITVNRVGKKRKN